MISDQQEEQRKQADLLAQLNQIHLKRLEKDQDLESSIQAMDMASRLQFSVPEVFDVQKETQATRDLYVDSEFGKGCLIARRLIEEGVRVVQLYHSIDGYDIAWDTGHENIYHHRELAHKCDQGIAALIRDLKERGMLDETLVIWGGEFGRTAYSQGALGNGRDHHGRCFSMWLAGGGIQGGVTYGETDDFAYNIARDPVHIRDLNATMLHCLGIDHERFSYRFQGLDQRLTGVEHAHVVKGVL